jgi:hypothetical protein
MEATGPYQHIFGRIAARVSDEQRIHVTAYDVQRLVDMGQGTGNPNADRAIKREAAEYGVS